MNCFFGNRERFHFTRHGEIRVNDECYISQFLPDRAVRGMTLEQLLDILIKLAMFNCRRAACVLLRGQNGLWVPSGRGTALKISKISCESFPTVTSNRSKAQAKDLRKSNLKTFTGRFQEKIFSVKFCFVICHFRVNSSGPARRDRNVYYKTATNRGKR